MKNIIKIIRKEIFFFVVLATGITLLSISLPIIIDIYPDRSILAYEIVSEGEVISCSLLTMMGIIAFIGFGWSASAIMYFILNKGEGKWD